MIWRLLAVGCGEGLADGSLVATLAVMQLPSATPPPGDACGPEELTARLDLALAAAREAGQLTLDYFSRSDLAVELKADDSPVTIADRGAEELLRARISAAFPDDAILGEEFPERSGTSGFRWIVDPIDGTKSFIHGVPLYGTLVAVEFQRRSVVGVIAVPAWRSASTPRWVREPGTFAVAGQRYGHTSLERRAWPNRCFAPATTRTGAAVAGKWPWSGCKQPCGCREPGGIAMVTCW